MLATHPDIYAAQRHHAQAVEPPTWDIIAPPFTPALAGRLLRIGTSLFNYSDFRIPTHPALWAALAQRTMLTLPTHDSTVATDNATALRPF